MTTDSRAVEEAVERLKNYTASSLHAGLYLETLITALKERTEALERIADPRNIHFTGDAQVVAARALGGHND